MYDNAEVYGFSNACVTFQFSFCPFEMGCFKYKTDRKHELAPTQKNINKLLEAV